MLQKEDVRVGALIWWSAERYISSWSCPCVVTHVSEDKFNVVSLDDFKQTDSLRIGDANSDECTRHEMRLCSLDEVKAYFKKRERGFEDAITEATRKLWDLRDAKNNYVQKVKEFLAKQE